MATRFELISALYDDISMDVVRSPSNWQEFLKSSCNNYGLPFSEQLLVYAQKPDAVAVLPMASWNRRFGRWVNKGAKGIALFDVSNQNYPRLKYVFDISDTHEGEQAKEVPIWHMKDEYANNVIKTLENIFGAVDDKSDLNSAVISACENAVSNNLSDYLFELCSAKQDSFLEDFSDDIISSKFRKLVSNSVSYTVLSRLGVDADIMLDTEDFEDVVYFNTPNTFNALGEATNNISKTALLEISKTVFALKKENRIFEKSSTSPYNKDENKNERSNSNEDNIHTSRRATLPEPDYADKDGTNGILRTEKTGISQESQENDIHNFIDNLQADGTLDVDSGTGTADGRTNYNSDGKNNHAYRLETYTYFVNHPDKADRIKYVSKDSQSGYLGGNDSVNKTTKGIEFSHGSVMEPYAKALIKWSDVAKRIDTLIKQNKFVTQEDIDAIPDIYKNEITRNLESFFEGLSENDASIFNRVTANRAKGKKTYIFIDEIYLLFQYEYSANFLEVLWKRVRKYGAYATGITQNVEDLLRSPTARTMLANSELVVMLNQAATDRIQLAELLGISDEELRYITNSEVGHGLLKIGSSIVPFENKFPKNSLYKLMSTKPGEE